jgi:hypothetical protein
MCKKGKLTMMHITVTNCGQSEYQVVVEEGAGRTIHNVTVTPELVKRYAPPGISAEKLVEASFEFLLERESKESILARFELPVIEHYFPEYPRKIRAKLSRAAE